ncbi:MAG: hypothetical protein K8R90_06840 [Candidatus Cloacimonetes bacterium]|nr:hypothetical protein [Candidatus Cloacimonadota bacterium]
MSKKSPMTGKASSRIQSSGAKNPGGATSKTGFASRAQRGAAKNSGNSSKK